MVFANIVKTGIAEAANCSAWRLHSWRLTKCVNGQQLVEAGWEVVVGWLKDIFRGPAPAARREQVIDVSRPIAFLAIDVETAARARDSICQIGLVAFAHDGEVSAQEILVNPGCSFEPMNTAIHGLTRDHVRDAPSFPDAYASLAPLIANQILVAHSRFDEGAISTACAIAGVPPPAARWIDSLVVAQSTWPELPDHKLPTVAAAIGHGFRHHHAVEDARASGRVLLEALKVSGIGLEAWVARSRPATRESHYGERASVRRDGALSGPLAGCCAVLTGDFSVPKGDLADMIALAGGAVAASVTRKTTLLVVGERDPSLYGGAPKSGKQLKAEQLRAAGQEIACLTERELRVLLA